MVELTVSYENGEAISWQRYRVPRGLSLADIQVCISSLLEWPTVPASLRVARTQVYASGSENNRREGQSVEVRDLTTSMASGSMSMGVIDSRSSSSDLHASTSSVLRLDRPFSDTRTTTRIFDDEEAAVQAANERISKMVQEGHLRELAQSSSSIPLPDEAEYPVFTAFESDTVSDEHWTSNNYYRLQMKVSSTIPLGWIAQVAAGIADCHFRTAETRIFRGVRTLFIWCEPQAEHDAVRELGGIVARRFRPSDHKLQRPKSYIVSAGGDQSTGVSQTAPQLALGSRGLMFQFYGHHLRWIPYREIRTNLFNSSLLQFVQYIEYKSRPERVLLLQTGPEIMMPQAIPVLQHVMDLIQAERWEMDSSLGLDLVSVEPSYPTDDDGKEIQSSDPRYHRAILDDLHSDINRFLDTVPDVSHPGGSASGGAHSLHGPRRRRSRYERQSSDNDNQADVELTSRDQLQSNSDGTSMLPSDSLTGLSDLRQPIVESSQPNAESDVVEVESFDVSGVAGGSQSSSLPAFDPLNSRTYGGSRLRSSRR